MGYIPIQDRITERDPFPVRWLQKVGVESKRRATVIVLIGSLILIVIAFLNFNRTLAPNADDDSVPLEEQYLYDDEK